MFHFSCSDHFLINVASSDPADQNHKVLIQNIEWPSQSYKQNFKILSETSLDRPSYQIFSQQSFLSSKHSQSIPLRLWVLNTFSSLKSQKSFTVHLKTYAQVSHSYSSYLIILVSIPVIKYHDQKQMVEERVCLTYTSISLLIIKESQLKQDRYLEAGPDVKAMEGCC